MDSGQLSWSKHIELETRKKVTWIALKLENWASESGTPKSNLSSTSYVNSGKLLQLSEAVSGTMKDAYDQVHVCACTLNKCLVCCWHSVSSIHGNYHHHHHHHLHLHHHHQHHHHHTTTIAIIIKCKLPEVNDFCLLLVSA